MILERDEIKKIASFYPLRLDFYSKKDNPNGRTDEQQAEYILQLVNFLHLNGYEKVGLAVSTNYQQTKGKKIYGGGQASVVNLMDELLDKDKNYSHLKGKITFLPITTCEFGGNKRGELKMEWVVDDIDYVNYFKRQEGNIVIGWKNQTSKDEYAYGGGVAGNLPLDIRNAIQTAFKGFEKEYKEKKSSQISIPCPLALKYCNLFQVYALSRDKAPDPNRLDDPWQYGKQLAERLSKCIFISHIEDDNIEGVLTIQSVLTSYLCSHVRKYCSNTAPKLIKLIDNLQKEYAVFWDWSLTEKNNLQEEEKNPQQEYPAYKDRFSSSDDDWTRIEEETPQEEISRHYQKAETTFFGSPKILYDEENKQACINNCIKGLNRLKVAGRDKLTKINLITNLKTREETGNYSHHEIYGAIELALVSIKDNKNKGFWIKNNNLKTFLKKFQNNMRKPDAENPTEGNGNDRELAERIRFFEKMLDNPHFKKLMATRDDPVQSCHMRNIVLDTIDFQIRNPTNFPEECVRKYIETNRMLISNPIYSPGYFTPTDKTSAVDKILEKFNTHCQNTPKKTL